MAAHTPRTARRGADAPPPPREGHNGVQGGVGLDSAGLGSLKRRRRDRSSVSRCQAPHCGIEVGSGRRGVKLYTGPDGGRTLCYPCNRLYSQGAIPVFVGPDGGVSLSCLGGEWVVATVVGFLPKERAGKKIRDFTKPVVRMADGSIRAGIGVGNGCAVGVVEEEVLEEGSEGDKALSERWSGERRQANAVGNGVRAVSDDGDETGVEGGSEEDASRKGVDEPVEVGNPWRNRLRKSRGGANRLVGEETDGKQGKGGEGGAAATVEMETVDVEMEADEGSDKQMDLGREMVQEGEGEYEFGIPGLWREWPVDSIVVLEKENIAVRIDRAVGWRELREGLCAAVGVGKCEQLTLKYWDHDDDWVTVESDSDLEEMWVLVQSMGISVMWTLCEQSTEWNVV